MSLVISNRIGSILSWYGIIGVRPSIRDIEFGLWLKHKQWKEGRLHSV